MKVLEGGRAGNRLVLSSTAEDLTRATFSYGFYIAPDKTTRPMAPSHLSFTLFHKSCMYRHTIIFMMTSWPPPCRTT